jgi:hypothetical protein
MGRLNEILHGSMDGSRREGEAFDPYRKALLMITLAAETFYLGLVCFADLALTALLLHTGHMTEANPILAYYLQFGLLAMCVVKLASFLIPLAIAEWYRHKRPQFITPLLRAALCLYIAGYVGGVAFVNGLVPSF